jgi:tetratricopeptide (TPR) repeat protein
MLETIREFALGLGSRPPDADDLRRRHAEFFLSVAEDAFDGIRSPKQPLWLERMEAEQDNFRSALRWALDVDDPSVALGITVGMSELWYLRGPVTEGRRWLTEALDRAPSVTETRAWALDWAGFLAAEQGDTIQAAALLEESIRCAEEAGAHAIQALAISHLTGALPPNRDDEIVTLGREAVSLARGAGNRLLLADTIGNLGESLRERGDFGAASVAYEESLTLHRQMGDPASTALCLVNLAEMAILAGDLMRASALASEALDLAQPLGDRRHVAFARAASGWIALAKRRPDDAASEFVAALELQAELGYAHASVSILRGLAGCAAANGDVARAGRLDAVATRCEAEIGHVPTVADSNIHGGYLDELQATTDPAVWEAEARIGETMSLEEAIAYALA